MARWGRHRSPGGLRVSKRSITQKNLHRIAKQVRQPLPAHIDLVQWLIDRGHAQTRGDARKIILAKRVKTESHVLGVKTVPVIQKDGKSVANEDVVAPYVPATLRKKIEVLP